MGLADGFFEGLKHPLYAIVVVILAGLLAFFMWYTWNAQDRTPQEIAEERGLTELTIIGIGNNNDGKITFSVKKENGERIHFSLNGADCIFPDSPEGNWRHLKLTFKSSLSLHNYKEVPDSDLIGKYLVSAELY